jgi:cellulose synthase/poly-beta-1,6-N-acetylglucosamine synthase-like glycosyltransferase
MAVVVPAHNESAHIAATVTALRASAEGCEVRIIVIADNCIDTTAEAARRSGAEVFERFDTTKRGKPFALRFALQILEQQPPEALAVVDADTLVEPTFVPAVLGRIGRGARAVQVHYAAGPAGSDLGRLRRLAFHLVHWSRPLGAVRLGLGCGLKGNGMAFDWETARVALGGDGLAEDAAATLALAARGIRVEFEPGTAVQGLMAQTYEAASTQDERWEAGRASLVREAIAVGMHELGRGRAATAAAAFEAGSLPLSVLGGLGLAAVALAAAGPGSVALGILALGSLGTYFAAGQVAARADRADLRALATAPGFLWHKARVYARVFARRTPTQWTRTARD